jgi:hypothetical protein
MVSIDPCGSLETYLTRFVQLKHSGVSGVLLHLQPSRITAGFSCTVTIYYIIKLILNNVNKSEIDICSSKSKYTY